MTLTTSTGREEETATQPGRRLPGWVNQRTSLPVILVVLVVIFGVARPTFFNQQLVLFPLLRDISIFTVVGLAQMTVMSIGHMNLAIGRMAAFSAMFMGIAYQEWGFPLYAGLLVGLVAGAAIGALAGWIITTFGVNSFVVTLAMDFALLGLVPLVYSQLTETAAFTVRPAGMDELRTMSLGDLCVGQVCGSTAVPQLLIFTLVAMAVLGYLYSRARLGRELLMTGSNINAARLSGIPTGRRVVMAHAMSGSLAALAGFMLAVTSGSFTANLGAEFMIPSFLGPVLGGTLLAGGFVSVVGTLFGTALTSVIRQGLTLLNIGLESLNIYIGVILLLALSTDRIRSFLSDRTVTRS